MSTKVMTGLTRRIFEGMIMCAGQRRLMIWGHGKRESYLPFRAGPAKRRRYIASICIGCADRRRGQVLFVLLSASFAHCLCGGL